MSDSVRPQRRKPARLPRPWDSAGKNTGVGCHFLLQCMKVKSESEVAQSCPTLRDPMDCSLPGFSIHGIFQARVLEWGAIAFSESDFGAPQNKVSHCFHCFPIYLPWSDGPDAMVLFCWIKVINSWGEGNLPSKRSQKLFSLVGNHKLWSEYQIDIKISLLLIKIL